MRLSDLEGRYPRARDRARALARRHGRDGVTKPTGCDPCTDVWEFVERLDVSY